MAVALVLSGFGLVTADSILFRQSIQRDLTTLARIIADNSTAALAFNDPDAGAQTLGSLRARPHVENACIYRMNGTVLASYARSGESQCPPLETQAGVRFGSGFVVVSQPIDVKGNRMGTLMLRYDLGEIADRIRLFSLTVLGVFFVSSVIAALLSSRLRDAIAGPIFALVNATRAVSQTGDYGIRAKRLSGDELGLLVDRFNEMLGRIQSRDNDLKQALTEREAALHEAESERERFHFLAESMPQKIYTATPTGNVDYYNRRWFEYTGLTFDEIKGWGWAQFVHPDDVQGHLETWRRSVSTGEPFTGEARFLAADGTYRWHLCRAVAMRDAAGNINMWIGSTTDIHEQKERQEELRRANADLEQFAYSASHDLQEPIRNVAIYSEIVARRYSNVLDEQGQQFLGILREGGNRLARLVGDLLSYTRTSMSQLAPVPVSSKDALCAAIENLDAAIRESEAEVTYDEALPVLRIGETHLQQLFQNLIGNALKYRSEQPPRVHVAAEKRGEFWCFSVTDNGIGIDPKYKEIVFGLFKRLQHKQYSGTGIGLAICKRVVERYGGRIWVESELGRGSTFYFTVPQYAEVARSAQSLAS